MGPECKNWWVRQPAGAGNSIKPGVERSATPGSEISQSHLARRAGDSGNVLLRSILRREKHSGGTSSLGLTVNGIEFDAATSEKDLLSPVSRAVMDLPLLPGIHTPGFMLTPAHAGWKPFGISREKALG